MVSSNVPANCNDSDYGSDFSDGEADIVNSLLESLHAVRAATESPAPVLASPSDAPVLEVVPAALDPSPALPDAYLAKSSYSLRKRAHGPYPTRSWHRTPPELVQLPDLSRSPPGLHGEFTSRQTQAEVDAQPENPEQLAARSPLERFRSFPRKPLTVTDLSSGAWCELQYAYVLTRLPGGRKTRTAAMRGGSAVHQKLEDQVHTAVRVSVARKEEAFALRMWNVIQGLRTLRDTGMTREFEVWGTIDGQLVNGAIDELSFACPVDEVEPLTGDARSPAPVDRSGKKQTPISKYLGSHHRQVYLLDAKTRGSTKLPTGAALRPTKIQLFLYHRMLCEMAAGKLDLPAVMARYGLEAEVRFSDTFMAQIGSLHDDIFDDADSDSDGSEAPEDRQDARPSLDATPALAPPLSIATDFIKYRCLSQLVPLLLEEISLTFPQGASNVADLLCVQYRHREDGRVVGSTTFMADTGALDNYIAKNMQWWHGRREPEGVPIEETYKCGYCEFAETCQWRMDKEKEIYDRKRAKATDRTGKQ
ncbi:exonuclease V a 5' deoxyribonuclease-domain-containing protein [Microdochium trichocladiopsis]|uniref:Exonuclease V a 5' deoxyribonuclease-domain-containing protein n=1 Tax=Microdochium trichocladiopsis TaxID=1682393 RepID=A0A9P9BR42_9PEZI|nr:exonuclease V a 5' deoxyribonuclease-domain-containing protein [Microdochium trichocladiopsis]KAH7031475.1 exonuclease V a 5' deoxyribonuclease-domain-containing protein [Microdochium trichocladiopsis]